jgi:uncharacterized protein (TIGR02466 family)
MMIDNLWGTPFYKTTIDEKLRFEVETYIMSNIDLDDPPGDVSSHDFFDSRHPLIQKLKQEMITQCHNYVECDNVSVKGWVTGTKDYSMTSHNHSGAHVSGVFYISTPHGGPIVFSDPRFNASRGYKEGLKEQFGLKPVTIIPQTGELILFPSFVYHEVPHYSGPSRRIALPVDFYIT